MQSGDSSSLVYATPYDATPYALFPIGLESLAALFPLGLESLAYYTVSALAYYTVSAA